MRKMIIAGLAAVALAGAAGAAIGQPPVFVVEERYGHWDPAWGVVPPPPRHVWRHWREHPGDWYSHVHSCMVRYHYYDPARDMYRVAHRWVICRY